MEQVVNKEKVFEWLLFVKRNNPLNENIIINETEVNDEIDIMISDSEDDDDEGSGVDVMTEALDEKEAPSHDTFMYHVNELCLEIKKKKRVQL
jgi:hypothetical protein